MFSWHGKIFVYILKLKECKLLIKNYGKYIMKNLSNENIILVASDLYCDIDFEDRLFIMKLILSNLLKNVPE